MSNEDALLDPLNDNDPKIQRFNKKPILFALALFLLVAAGFYYMIEKRGKQETMENSRRGAFGMMDDLSRNIRDGKQRNGVIGENKKPLTVPTVPVQKDNIVFPTDKEKEEIVLPNNGVVEPPPKTWEELQEERLRTAKQDRYEAAINGGTKISGGSGGKKTSGLNNSQAGGRYNTGIAQNRAGGLSSLNSVGGIKQILSQLGGGTSLGGNTGGGLGRLQQPTRAQQNLAFLNQNVAKTPYLDNTRTAPRSIYEIRTGTIIPSILMTRIDSQLPSMIIAQVSENVYDTATGRYLLIPQGSKLVGKYNSQTFYGQSRLGIVWNRLIYPDASAIELGSMAGADAMGRAGVSGYTNNHYGKLFTAAILTSLLDYGVSKTNDLTIFAEGSPSNSLNKTVAKITTKIIDRTLNIPPTITIVEGKRMNVMVNKDIVFPRPWHDKYEPLMQ